jgi:hypothetical protein
MIRQFLAAAFVGFSLASAVAQSLESSLDPVCGLPRLRLRGNSLDSNYVLRSAPNLDPATPWESVLNVSLGNGTRTWVDTTAPGHSHRFYRLEKVEINPPFEIADNFRLIDHAGYSHELFHEGDADAVVLVFADNDGLAQAWPAIKRVRDRFSYDNVRFWFVNPRDDRGAIAAKVAALGVDVPVLHDEAQLVTHLLGGSASPEAVLLQGGSFTPIYRGAIEDRCETAGGTVVQGYLEEALGRFLANQPIAVTAVRAQRTPLNLAKVPAYGTDIAPILRDGCVRCHSPGNIGSWAMTNYAAVASKTREMRRDLLTGDMPPWHVDRHFGTYANDFSIKPSDRAKLIAWLEAGAPRGEGADPLEDVPPPPEEWTLGPPDMVISIASQVIPANGVLPYRHLFPLNPLTEDVWLRAAVVKPGNATVVHHVLVFAGDLSQLAELQGGLGGYFSAYVPGMEAATYPEGTGKLLKAGAILYFQMHYTPNGTATTDRTQLGLYFAKTKPARELKTSAAYQFPFQSPIPPNNPDFEMRAQTAPLAKPAYIYEFSPHMHYRGARMRFEIVQPGNPETVETIGNVPAYQFDWQTVYRFSEPRLLPAGSFVRVVGAFDNSIWNPRNPDPNKSVDFGLQSSDEMFIGYLNYSEVE